jgi:hypothetical protein
MSRVPESLFFTESDEANELIATDPMALLVGFALDQQVSVQKAFAGPLVIKERVGTLDAAALADADLDSVFRQKPAVHRFPGSMPRASTSSRFTSGTSTAVTPSACGLTRRMATSSAPIWPRSRASAR